MSTRYLYWRATHTLNFNTSIEGILGTGLFLAEIYSWIILVLGYFQTAWPLNRKNSAITKRYLVMANSGYFMYPHITKV